MPASRTLLLVAGSYPPAVCGVGDYTAGLARSIAGTGRWRVSVATALGSVASDDDRKAGVDVLPLFDTWSFSRLVPAARAIGGIHADIVHMQFPTQGYGPSYSPWFLPLVLSLRRGRVVQTWHEYVPRPWSLRPLAAATAGVELIVVRPGYAERIPWPHRLAMRGIPVTHISNVSNLPVTRLTEAERLALRQSLVGARQHLIGYFGFAYPHKRVDLLFDLLDPEKTQLLFIGRLDQANAYHRRIMQRMQEPRWRASVHCTGFVPAERAADLLAACDAMVLPFADGGGDWNTSLHAVQSQGTFLLTTSTTRDGYSNQENTLYRAPSDIDGMRKALAQDQFPRSAPRLHGATWEDVARAHEAVYERALASTR